MKPNLPDISQKGPEYQLTTDIEKDVAAIRNSVSFPIEHYGDSISGYNREWVGMRLE
jgi:hypothetical protein